MIELPKYPSDDVFNVRPEPSQIRFVGILEATKSGVRNTFNFKGRATRAELFWFAATSWFVAVLPALLIEAILEIPRRFLDASTQQSQNFASIVCFSWVGIALLSALVRRMHDIGRSGHTLWFIFIPLGSIYLIVLTLFESKLDVNRYGSPQLKYNDDSSGVRRFSNIKKLSKEDLSKYLQKWGVSALGMIVIITALGSIYLNYFPNPNYLVRDSNGEIKYPGTVKVGDFYEGDCFRDLKITPKQTFENYFVVNCSDPHTYEVFAQTDIVGGILYDQNLVISQTETFCLNQFSEFVGVDFDSSEYAMSYLYPVSTSWNKPFGRQSTCLIGLEDKSKFTGSLKDAYK